MNNQQYSATGSAMPHRNVGSPTAAQPAANPLKNFFRQYKLFIRLPSGDQYYPDGTVDYNASGEVGIMAMTGQDELILKNPDALLNGEALVQVISSCVPAVRNVRALLTNDIDALITAIRFVTYNDKLETAITCPNCKHENLYKIDLENTLNSMTYLEPEYLVHLPSGLSVHIKPYGFTEVLKSLHTQFEQSKQAMAVVTPGLSDEERNHILNGVFMSLAKTTYELTLASITRVVNESQGIDVTDRTYIAEFLRNVDRSVTELIQKSIKDANAVGVQKAFEPVCEKCNHTWHSEIDFNPVNFS